MPIQVEYEGTVHEFPDDFTDADIAAALGGSSESASPVSTSVLAGVGAGMAAPGIVSGINTLAKGAGSLAKSTAGKYAPGVVAIDAAGRVARGDYKGAAGAAATGAAMTQLPRAASAVQKASSPLVQAVKGASGRFITGGKPAGWMARAAGGMSNAAGALAMPLTLTSGVHDLAEMTRQMMADPNTPPERKALLEQLLERAADPTSLR